MNSFKVVKTKEASMDAFDLKNKWMLVTAAKPDGSVNTMTANWGGLGIMWNKEVAYVVIRPQRFTKEFVDEATTFTLTFFAEDYKKKALTYLGKVSGRDEDKIAKAGLPICKDEEGVPYFAEAESVFFVKKLFVQPMVAESFLDKEIISQWYPEGDFHHLYIAEVCKVMIKE